MEYLIVFNGMSNSCLLVSKHQPSLIILANICGQKGLLFQYEAKNKELYIGLRAFVLVQV